MQASVRYGFSQRLNAPAREAYRWCTDYQPDDLSLMHERGERKIQWVTDDTVILREVVDQDGKRIRKVKLVKLDPANLSWYNIHLSGPSKHSAFTYRMTPEGKNRSKLTFTGLLVVYSKTQLNDRKLKQIARDERRYDSNAWKHLARALSADINNPKDRKTSSR